MTTPLRSKHYLDWVRNQPCWTCGTNQEIHAHHHGRTEGGGGMGLKTCDLHTVPLCRKCHEQWHRRGTIQSMSRDKTVAELWRAVAVLLRRALIEGVVPSGEVPP